MTIPVPMWLDCDPGHDDAFAILLAAHHPALRLLGVSTVHGNASLDRTTYNAGSILTAIGRSDIHVYPGAHKPFCRNAVHAPNLHGESGLAGTKLLPSPCSPPITHVPAIVAMRDALLAEVQGTAWLVAIGTLTNVALLFTVYPELIGHIKGLSIMGGAVGEGYTAAKLGQVDAQSRFGNITPYAEFNVYGDPEAARSIFSLPELTNKTWLLPLDLTHLAIATPEIQSQLLHGQSTDKNGDSVSPLRQMLHDLLLFFAKTYDEVYGLSTGPPMNDPVAVAILLDHSSARFGYRSAQSSGDESWIVEVVTAGEYASADAPGMATVGHESEAHMLGRTVLRQVPPGYTAGKGHGVKVPRSVDVDWFWEEMLAAIDRAEQHVTAS